MTAEVLGKAQSRVFWPILLLQMDFSAFVVEPRDLIAAGDERTRLEDDTGLVACAVEYFVKRVRSAVAIARTGTCCDFTRI